MSSSHYFTYYLRLLESMSPGTGEASYPSHAIQAASRIRVCSKDARIDYMYHPITLIPWPLVVLPHYSVVTPISEFIMHFLKCLSLLSFVTAIASGTPDASPDRDVDTTLSKLSELTGPLLDGLTKSLAGVSIPDISPRETSTEGKAIKRQAQDPQQGLSDALNSLLPVHLRLHAV